MLLEENEEMKKEKADNEEEEQGSQKDESSERKENDDMGNKWRMEAKDEREINEKAGIPQRHRHHFQIPLV